MSKDDNQQKAIMIDYDAEKLATDTARHLGPILFEIVESIEKKRDNEKEKPLSKTEAAKFLGIHTSTLSKLISEGRINFTSLNPDNKETILLGKSVYVQNCASCHGTKLEGQKNWMLRLPDGLMPAPPHDETGHTWHHSDKYLFMITKYGIEDIIGQKYPNNMPAYKDILSDKEIISVLSYIKSTWPNKVKKIHDQINNREKSK